MTKRLHLSPFSAPSLGLLLVCCLGLVLTACESHETLETIRQRQALGDVAGTIEPLRELLEAEPANAELNFLYGRALLSTGQLASATWPLRRAMQDPEWLVSAGTELAYATLTTGDYNEVVEITSRILAIHPENQTALLFRAQAHAHWKKDPEAALADADRVLELAPDAPAAFEPRILALIALDRLPEARESLAEAGRLLEETDAPSATLAWHCSTTAVFTAEAGERERAEEIWRDCLEKFPSNPSVVTGAVEFYDAGEAENWQRSLDILSKAIEAMPGQTMFRYALAERLRRSGKPVEGEALLLEATQVDDLRSASDAWIELARFRHARLEHGRAADALAKAVELVRSVKDPSPQLLFQYADALVLSGRLEQASEIAEEISVPAHLHMIRGRVAQEQGGATAALEEFDEALRIWPDNASARYYTALAAEQLGDFDRALEEYRYSIRIAVAATDARTRAAQLLIAENQPMLAYQLLFFEISQAPLDPEGELLSMYLMARVANPKQLQSALMGLATRNAAVLPSALARGALGAAEIAGPRAALNLLRDAPGVDYTDPGSAPALRALVRFAHASGDVEAADRAISTARLVHPEAAVFHEISGLHLELSGAALESVHAAYRRSVELDPGNPGALAGLGRLAALANDSAAAISLFDAAVVADSSDPVPELAAARVVIASGRLEEARQRLNRLLSRHPFEAEAASELVALDLAADEGAVTTETLERGLRAARFGGGAAAYERLSEIYTRLDQPDPAHEAATRAQLLRERQAAIRSASGA
jgi:tetratricopeptide (TPR) repeat protein